ncbi:uncharacterized protein AKAME5_001948700 [Lates japonicus]|uniref:Uncharacterized protein n=1 Tax=Lates japonicus TaxID=270547 RepID=A0AAD3RHI6_LATJO|nr:uncharacterized protein AKAME5_001948700 [Lates japonicus]
MAGSGVALRLHEFRESQDSREPDGQITFTPQASRPGRDVHGLYPGQLGRVHVVHSKDCGGRSRSLHESPENYQQSFDIRTLRALTVLCHSPAVLEQRPPQTAYQEEFGLQSSLFPQ